MDILNFISWIKGGRQVTTVDATRTLIPLGLKDNRRDDGYLAGAITVQNLLAQVTPVLPYKVYTALLTQSGVQTSQVIGSGDLTIGVTYFIDDNSGNPDFTNVGAPNNNSGTAFVATGTTPNSWGNSVISNVLNYDTGAPVATVLENTIGNIWFAYNGAGGYLLYRDSDFIPEKVFAILTNNLSGNIGLVGDNMALGFECYPNAPYIAITSTTNGVATDGVLYNTPIEIRVYN
jgi:hypothetical protein